MNKSNYKRYNTANVSGTSTLEGLNKSSKKSNAPDTREQGRVPRQAVCEAYTFLMTCAIG